MFSQTLEYALRAMVWLAQHPGQSHTRQAIAAGTQVPVDYLAKVMRPLAARGLVSASRGLRGGFWLAREPEHIRILDIVDAVEPIPRIRSCPLGLPSHGRELCALHRRMDDAMAATEKNFRATRLTDLMGGRGSRLKPLCDTAALRARGRISRA